MEHSHRKRIKKKYIKEYIEKFTRVNFSFNLDRYEKLRKQPDYYVVKIEKMNRSQFMEFQGTVIPRLFWDSYEDFEKKGIAYTVIENNDIASIAYSAYVHGNKLEIGIETAEKYRQKGYAIKACARLIEYCLLNNLEPIWACKLENTSSYRLAIKLGFDEKVRYPYYGLKNPNPI
jgi:RimJ/RimL family protein N-acetyltransferase